LILLQSLVANESAWAAKSCDRDSRASRVRIEARSSEILLETLVQGHGSAHESPFLVRNSSTPFLISRIDGIHSNWLSSTIYQFEVISADLEGERLPVCVLVMGSDGKVVAHELNSPSHFAGVENYSHDLEALKALIRGRYPYYERHLRIDYPEFGADPERLKLVPSWKADLKLPIFPTVYPFENPYVMALLKNALPRMAKTGRVLVLGSGTGFDAAVIAARLNVPVDALDINALAVANTRALAVATKTDHLVQSWVSDLFSEVKGKYQTIVFNGPLPVEAARGPEVDANREDLGGVLLRRLFAELPEHLETNGNLFLMSHRKLNGVPSSLIDQLIGMVPDQGHPIKLGIHQIQIR
jgi:SAM-dependent methyltransferase